MAKNIRLDVGIISRYKDGVNTTPEESSMSKKYEYSDGIFEEALADPCHIRKISDGYYVAYTQEAEGSDYTMPCWFLMKVHQDSNQYIADYPLPQ